MYLYNITVNINSDVHDDWLQWMKDKHIPDVMRTGLFTENRICRLLNTDDEGFTYSIQYSCRSLEDYHAYRDNHAPILQKDVKERYKDKFVAFRTLMQIV